MIFKIPRMSREKVIVGIGELLWDILPTGKMLGGAPCNFAYHAMKTGSRSYVISAIGDDDLGREIIKDLKLHNISCEYVQTSNYPTGTVSVKLDVDGLPDYTIHQDVAWDNIEWNKNLLKLAKECDAVCFGSLAQRNSLSRDTVETFLSSLSSSCLKVFDINLRQSFYSADIIERSLNYANIFKLNDDELEVISPLLAIEGDIEERLKEILKRYNLDYIAYTMGSEGSILMSSKCISKVSAPKVDVVDTVGAGDSFTSRLVTGVLNNRPLNEIHKEATEVAARVCASKGAMSN